MNQIKEMLLEYLDGPAKQRLVESKAKYEEQLEKRRDYCYRKDVDPIKDKYFVSRQGMIDQEKGRDETRKWVMQLIRNLEFERHIPEEFKKYLSPYGTFCDRYTMYYDRENVNQYNKYQIIQIILCELFNSLSDYFTFTEFTELQLKIVKGTSFMAMYHIGVISNKAWYSNGVRRNVVEKYEKKYNERIMAFKPNQLAGEYLLKKAIYDDPKRKFTKNIYTQETAKEISTYELYYQYLVVTTINCRMATYNWFHRHESGHGQIVYFNDKTKERCHPQEKNVQEHRNMIKLANKLAGI